RAGGRTAFIALKALRRRFHGDAPTGYRWLRRCCWYTSPFDRIYRPALAPYPTPCHGYCLRVRQDTPTGSRPRREAADRRTGTDRGIANVTPVRPGAVNQAPRPMPFPNDVAGHARIESVVVGTEHVRHRVVTADCHGEAAAPNVPRW